MKTINIITLTLVILCILFYGYVPVHYRQMLYGTSMIIKDVVLMVLPFIIFSFLLDVIVSLRTKAMNLLVVFLFFVVLSTSIAVVVAYFIGITFITNIDSGSVTNTIEVLTPLWNINIPQFLSPQNAIIFSIISGILMIVILKEKAITLNKVFYNLSDIILKKMIMPVIPIFVAGFVMKICHDQLLKPVFDHYLYIFLLFVISSFIYITFIYLFLTGKKFFTALGNMFPALVTAFSTMSSAITMPLLILASEKNTNNSHTTISILPAATNFHMLGECFNVTLCFIAVTFTFTGHMVAFNDFLLYLMYFVYFRFSTVGIPGGGAIVLSPMLIHNFGFSPEMISLFTTLYIVFDPINTVMNIYGNGAFAIFFSKIYKK